MPDRRYFVPVLAIALLGCANPSGVDRPAGDVRLRLSPVAWPQGVPELEPGDTLLLHAQIYDDEGLVPGARPVWNSSAPQVVSVASVEPGVACQPCLPGYYARAIAGAQGRAGLTVLYGTASASLTVDVRQPVLATLVVDRYSVVQRLESDGYAYYPTLRLRERTGLADGWVTEIRFHLEGLGDWGSVPAWEVSKRVPAGGSAEMIEEYYGEPEFWITGGRSADTVSVRVDYRRDALGRMGSLVAKAAVEVRSP